MVDVTIVPTGSANIASLMAAFNRLDARVKIAATASDVMNATHLVLPGVGAFGAAMAHLRACGMVEALVARWNDPRPALGICLGMQLLFERSEESPGAVGLGVVRGGITRLPKAAKRVPFFGWSDVAGEGPSGCAYFAHSFAAGHDAIGGWKVSRAFHDGAGGVVAAITRHEGRHLACQFHPELSSAWGQALLSAWLRGMPVPQSGSAPAARTSVRVIPCLDVRDGRVVKGVQFLSLRDAGDPVAQAAAYQAQGADELVMLDVSATTQGRRTAATTVAALRRVLSIPLTVGGGIRTVEDASVLIEAGADKIAVNTAAVSEPALLSQLAQRFGAQCVVLALDAKSNTNGGWHVKVRSGTDSTPLDAVAWAREAQERGAGEILLTSVDRDGTEAGYDLELLTKVCSAVHIPVIASGGASNALHMAQAIAAGADAVLAASIFHDARCTVGDVKQELNALGVAVRGGSVGDFVASQGGSTC